MNRLYLFAAPVAVIATVAHAGEEPLYQDAPDWIVEALLPEARPDDSKQWPILIADRQTRMEDGRVWSYQDTALRLSTPQLLTQLNTITANWLPDKGDLIVHRLELIRGGKLIDLVEQGSRFEVLRRESQLEQRMLDGQLTGTINIAGAQLGDIIRIAYSTTLSDQALGDKMQVTELIPAGDISLGTANVRISWPEDEVVKWRKQGEFAFQQPTLKDGYYTLSVALPVKQQEDKPYDAPARYSLPPLIQATNFTDYADLSRTMYPHFTTEGTIAPGGPIAAEVTKIMAEHSTQLARAAAATKVVQDDVSYLMNGLNGGNYLPQSPQETWESRYGDCKAKSLLLHAMLQEMGIQSQVVLAKIQNGDTAKVLLPLAGNFDHMIVRAIIDGQDYWLDGTSNGTRLENIGDVPRFHVILPITKAGSDLYELEERPKAVPDQLVTVTVDQSAGLFLPGLFEARIEKIGAAAAQWELADAGTDEIRDQTLDAAVAQALGNAEVISGEISYDKETSRGVVTARGIIASGWDRKRGYSETAVPAQLLSSIFFNVDRSKVDWRDIPVEVSGPSYNVAETTLILPDGGAGIVLRGDNVIDKVVAGTQVLSETRLNGDRLVLKQSRQTIAREIPADRIRAEKVNAARLARNLPKLRSTADVRQNWEYYGKDRERIARLEQAYTQLIEKAIRRADDIDEAYANRAQFRRKVYDWEGAVADFTRANEEEASAYHIEWRADSYYRMGKLEEALTDYEMVEELHGDGGTLYRQAEILAYLGRHDEAIAAAEEYAAFVKEADAAEAMSYMLSYAGRREEASLLIDETLLLEPDETWLLNTACWQAGIFNEVNDATLDICTQAVEEAKAPQNALDSRALAHYRMGELDKALLDVEAALKIDPTMAGSRYLRGLIRIAMGDRGGQVDIDAGLRMDPIKKKEFTLWNILK